MKTRLERGKRMKKKGFTLIELLAVIVILAIIALIAVPVVMNIISKANKSAFKDSAYGILKAGESYYTSELLENSEGITEDVTFTFPNNIAGLEFQGSKPTGGTMTVRKDGKISMAIHNGKHCVTKGFEDEDIKISDDISNCNISNGTLTSLAKVYTFKKQVISTSLEGDGTVATTTTEEDEVINVPACITNKTKCDAGTPVAVEVAPNVFYKFYVLNDDTTKNEVTLIMDRNLGEKVAWDDTTGNAANNLGPITALNYLNVQTKNWNNIPAISNYDYTNTAGTFGYQKLEIVDGKGKLTSKDGATITEIAGESKARLLTYEEVTSTEIGCIETTNGSCPSWLYGNLSSSNATEQPAGYWLLSAYSYSPPFSYYVYYAGFPNFAPTHYDDFDDNGSDLGVRPVITLSK